MESQLYSRNMMGFFQISLILSIFVAVAPTNGTTCDDELCCYVQQMSSKCSSKNNAMKLRDAEKRTPAVSERAREEWLYDVDKRIKDNCCKGGKHSLH